MPTSNAQRAAALAKRIKAQIERAAGKGVEAAAKFLAARVKETLSVPAPRARSLSRTGVIYYRATTRATPGAPPRKLSGTLRQRIAAKMLGVNRAAVGTNVVYAKYHERGNHKFMAPTVRQYRKALTKIVGGTVRVLMRTK